MIKYLNILLIFPFLVLCQNNEEIREINSRAIELIDNYFEIVSGVNKDWPELKKNELIKLFDSADSQVFNDVVPDSKFTKDISIEDYAELLYSSFPDYFNVSKNILEIRPISDEGQVGEIDLIIEKIINNQFDINQKEDYNLVINNESKEYKEIINYKNSFILRFTIIYDKNDITENFKIKRITKHIKNETIKPSFFVPFKQRFPSFLFKKEIILKDTLISYYENDEKIDLNQNLSGLNVKYFFTLSPELYADKIFKLNDNNYRVNKPKKREKIGNNIYFTFSEKLNFSSSINLKINDKIELGGFNQFHENISSENVTTNQKQLLPSISFLFFPFKKEIFEKNLNKFYFQPGLKLTLERSQINFRTEIPNFKYEHTDIDEEIYNRWTDLSLFDEQIILNKQSVHLVLKFLNEIKIEKNSILKKVSPFTSLNISLFNNRIANYENNWEGTIEGEYPTYFNAILHEGVYDFGETNSQHNETLNVKSSLLDLSEISLGVDLDFERIGLNINLTHQIAPKNIVNLSNEPIILTDSYSDDNIGGQIITNSITEVLNSFSVNNTYICIGINFKL